MVSSNPSSVLDLPDFEGKAEHKKEQEDKEAEESRLNQDYESGLDSIAAQPKPSDLQCRRSSMTSQ